MSQQHGTGPSPPSSSAQDGARGHPGPSTAPYSSTASSRSREPPGRDEGAAMRPNPAFTLPPLRGTSDMPPTEGSRGITRSLNVHSILNPPQVEPGQQRARRRGAAEMESSQTGPLPAPSRQPRQFPSGGYDHSEEVSPRGTVARGGPASRRILSPRSPSLHRAGGLGFIQPATGSIDAQQSPFLSSASRPPMAEPGTAGVPLLPTPPAIHRTGYNFPTSAAPTPPIVRRRASVVAQSASASPSTSYSSYSQAGQTSPATPYAQGSGPAQSSYILAPSGGFGGLSQAPPVSVEGYERSYGIPVASTGQSSYQILTLETQQGPVQLPVDVQAASRVADEKRKRNAGASARFRARRKIKEANATSTISKLEQEIRELTEDNEFYKRDREALASLLFQTPGGDRHFPRPQSPRHRRTSVAASSTGAPSTSGSGSGAYSGMSERGERSQTERNTRRRTSTFSLPPPTVPPATTSQSGYPISAFPPLVPAPPGYGHQGFGARAEPAAGQPPPPRSDPRGPYTSERYDRSWPSGSGDRGQPPM